MKITANLHTHTHFCDGLDTPEELVLAALEKGFTVLGFSSHGYTPFDDGYSMSAASEKEYRREIAQLKEKYRGEITILCGIEQDYYCGEPEEEYDFIIGSVHYVKKAGEYFTVDESAEQMGAAVAAYDGDFDELAEDYFKRVGKIVSATQADIIGHFDLIMKFSAQNGYAETEQYLAAAEKAVKALIPHEKPFEINTGGMARGGKPVPYPSPQVLKMIYENGGKITFSSDCHDKDQLDYGFDTAIQIAKECGFKEYVTFGENGFETRAFD